MENQTWNCDVCGSTDNILAGRWLFYCPEHKANDHQKTVENELRFDDGDLNYMLDNADAFQNIIFGKIDN